MYKCIYIHRGSYLYARAIYIVTRRLCQTIVSNINQIIFSARRAPSKGEVFLFLWARDGDPKIGINFERPAGRQGWL